MTRDVLIANLIAQEYEKFKEFKGSNTDVYAKKHDDIVHAILVEPLCFKEFVFEATGEPDPKKPDRIEFFDGAF